MTLHYPKPTNTRAYRSAPRASKEGHPSARGSQLRFPQPARVDPRRGVPTHSYSRPIKHAQSRTAAAAAAAAAGKHATHESRKYQKRVTRTPPIPTSRYQSLPKGELQERYHKHLLKLVNRERQKHDAQPVKLDPKLSTCARRHNADLAFTQQRLSHVSNDGAHLSQRLKKCGYHFRYASENVARGQKNPEHVVNSWMNSEGHRKNLISQRAKKMGVHVGRGVDGRIYWSQMFANA